MSRSFAYPTNAHADAARAITEFFLGVGMADAVLLTNSCARAKATPDSCLDIAILIGADLSGEDRARLEAHWKSYYADEPLFETLKRAGRFAEVHLDITDGQFEPQPRDWTSGSDSFELEIGNTFVYSVPLWQRNGLFDDQRARWLPYYGDDLRQRRLAMARMYCINNLDHIPIYIRRGLYFQCFNRLYDAFREFLQLLFISRRTYPIAYDKWIKEQVAEILGLAQLYVQLPRLFEVSRFESDQIAVKAQTLRRLLDEWVLPD